MEKLDLYTRITNRIVAELEKGCRPRPENDRFSKRKEKANQIWQFVGSEIPLENSLCSLATPESQPMTRIPATSAMPRRLRGTRVFHPPAKLLMAGGPSMVRLFDRKTYRSNIRLHGVCAQVRH
jgi:hypothetical protein